jgi:putative ABC transport system substrate-binding protein
MPRSVGRRAFVSTLGGAALSGVWPDTLRAQRSGKHVIGFLSLPSIAARRDYLARFFEGLRSEGFVEDQSVSIEIREANGNADKLPGLASELVQRRVAVIVTSGGPPAALAAQRATNTIPIVFSSGADPVKIGLVSSFNRPGGNLTGMFFPLPDLVAKRLALFHEMLPKARRIAALVNPTNREETEPTERNLATAGSSLGLETRVFNATSPSEIDRAFAAIAMWRPDALFVGPDPFFGSSLHLVALTRRHRMPSSFFMRTSVEAGGLMSYGPNIARNFFQIGVYAGRILKGSKAGELPVMLPTNFELVVNVKTARTLGIEVPPMLLARVDEVIE